jgi:hypothetical protein
MFELSQDIVMKTSLRMDALYYHASCCAYKAAQRNTPAISKAQTRIQRLIDKEQKILDAHGGDLHAAVGELESIHIQMEDAEYQMGQAHGPLLQQVAAVHILSAASLEAHINAQANELLSGKLLEEFDRLSLQCKWLMLPLILGKTGFDAGTQPFQRFSKLVNRRNVLVHYKVKQEDWKSLEVPTFIEKLSLNLEAAQESLDAARAMIVTLAELLGQEKPNWFDFKTMSFFEVKFK